MRVVVRQGFYCTGEFRVPVLIALGLELIQCGSVRPVKKENPMMKRLRDEFKSTY